MSLADNVRLRRSSRTLPTSNSFSLSQGPILRRSSPLRITAHVLDREITLCCLCRANGVRISQIIELDRDTMMLRPGATCDAVAMGQEQALPNKLCPQPR